MKNTHSKDGIKAAIVAYLQAERCGVGEGRRLSNIAMWYDGPYPAAEDGTDVMFADAVTELESEGYHVSEAMGGAFIYLIVGATEPPC